MWQVFDSTVGLSAYNILCTHGPMAKTVLFAMIQRAHPGVVAREQFDRAVVGLVERKRIVLDADEQVAVIDTQRRIVVTRSLEDAREPNAAFVSGWSGWLVKEKTGGGVRALEGVLGEKP